MTLSRNEEGAFGFGLTGGLEYDHLPCVDRVGNVKMLSSSNGPIEPGDGVVAINGINVAGETHDRTLQLIRCAGDTIELVLLCRRGQHAAGSAASAAGAEAKQPAMPAPTRISDLLRLKSNGARNEMVDVIHKDVLRTVYTATIPCTTRAPRPGEVAGVNYHFLTVEQFRNGIDRGEFLEWGLFNNHYYGTRRQADEPAAVARRRVRQEKKKKKRKKRKKSPALAGTL